MKIKALAVPEGDGVVVKRLMPSQNLRNYDPFVLCDHFDIESGGFPDHPHRGFEAITYMLAGGMQHADNLGNRSTVYAGGAQRFTAGKGIVHSEIPQGRAVGLQLWINLPQKLKHIEPAYQQVDAADIKVEKKDGVLLRHIVGEAGIILQTPVLYLDISLLPQSHYEVHIPDGFRGFVYVLQGHVWLQEQHLHASEALFIEGVQHLQIQAKDNSQIMVCFGLPHGEPIYQHGPFVD
ncbi:MAG: pirin family protein [Mariprofundaceae bacterium]|nr:pirin family protein [Mariprofundaceae bacterium]